MIMSNDTTTVLMEREHEAISSSLLDLSSKQLTSIPEAVFVQNDLEALWIDDNPIQNIPENIGCLTELKLFSAYKNGLRNIPEIFLLD